MSDKQKSEEDVDKSQDMSEDVIGILREENEKLKKQLEGCASKELTKSVLEGALAQMRKIADDAGALMREASEGCDSIVALLSKLGSAKLGQVKSDVVSSPPLKWHEKDGVIYFSVTSDGTTGSDWINCLESKNFQVGSYAKSVLWSKKFKPTSGITTQIAILKGELFPDNDRITENIRVEAQKRGFQTPNAEIACLIREKFSDQEIEAMGIWWIVTMHDPIEDSDGDPGLLSVDRDGVGRWLGAYDGNPGSRWYRGDGFAFAVSQ